MNDHDFEDPSHDEVRRLLAQAAAPPSIPPEVAAALDATLADLVSEHPAAAGTSGPRVRRFPGRFLLAAAAVVLLGLGGLGVAQLVSQDESALSASNDSTGSTGQAEEPTAELAAPETGPEDLWNQGSGGTAVKTPAPASGGTLDEITQLNKLRVTSFTAAGFAEQVAQVAGRTGSGAYADPTGPKARTDDPTPLAAATSCSGPETAAGAQSLLISFEGKPAVLVINPVIEGSRYVAAWSCDGNELLASTTIR